MGLAVIIVKVLVGNVMQLYGAGLERPFFQLYVLVRTPVKKDTEAD
jgi:hypothetical protein